jgi:hypothetical protein
MDQQQYTDRLDKDQLDADQLNEDKLSEDQLNKEENTDQLKSRTWEEILGGAQPAHC